MGQHDERLAQAGYFTTINGVSHAALTTPAYERLAALLRGHGNRLSKDHEAALYALVGSMTQMAQGKLQGRWAFGMPTGMGKTTAIEAWLATLHSAGNDHVSVAVAASKVEALAALKRNLIALGVPAEKIGLVHTKLYDPAKVSAVCAGGHEAERYASEPSEGADRPILLITHQRVRGSSLATFNSYRGKPRDLLLYDESLIVSDSLGISIPLLKGALGFLQGAHGDSPKHAALITYLSECLRCIASTLSEQQTGAQVVTRLPDVPQDQLEPFCVQLRHPALEPARQLLEIVGQRLRVIPTGQGGVVSYQVSVPAEIENVLVLDASQPIRRLVHLDSTIKDAEEELPQMKRVGVPLSRLKTFNRVTVNQMFAGGGRDTVGKSFANDRAEDRKVVREVVEVARNVPAENALLIFTYKQRSSKETDFKGTLFRDLEAAGIDTAATVETPEGTAPRVNIVTWGMETSLNDYAHCRHVVLAGVMQRSPVDIAAAYLGQSNDLGADLSSKIVQDVHRSEVCHMIYQALSRGACRTVDNGSALPMQAWIIHRDDRIKEELEKVMPGAVWAEWKPVYLRNTPGVIASLSRRIATQLESLSPETTTISTSKLKKTLTLKQVPQRTWTTALQRHLEAGSPWLLRGRSLVRASTVFGN